MLRTRWVAGPAGGLLADAPLASGSGSALGGHRPSAGSDAPHGVPASGVVDAADGPGRTPEVLVSVTAFTADRFRDLPGIASAGRALGREWPSLGGAVGMWLWVEPSGRRCGSVSLWTDERALRAFVALPAHLAIVRRYRRRGSMRSTTWTSTDLDRAAAWSRARRFLASGPESAP